MSTPSARLLVWAGDRCACVRIIGRANFTSSIDFAALITELRQQGCNYVVLDLAECVLMDSTFLGVLASFGLKLSARNGAEGPHGIELLNPSARIMELLDTLGVLHLFKVTQGSVKLPEQAELREQVPLSPTKEEVTRTCIEAHQTLMEISPANVSRFKDVTQFLAEGLKKSRTVQP
jgi:anti-sigma B factor antagonist